MYNTDMPSRAELPSTQKLLRSTAAAIVVAGVLLSTVVMPSEYGIDPTGLGSAFGLTEMGKIKAALAAEAAADEAASPRAPKTPPAAIAAAAAPAAPKAEASAAPLAAAGAVRSDEMSVSLKPGEGTEVKMAMVKGATVHYEWKTDGGLVNHDTHGDPANGPANTFHRYKKEKQVSGNSGDFEAVFDGNHGWFWRNRSDKEVKIFLKTTGAYSSIKRMM
ncbi:transmembrane anchor protein [Massilia cavernae]|uniref:Transmembrane anchor protein n=1 Tax=Massilia cavernae TaxID=2320864 RepID=A0A418X7C5_9BURK|nr:transmembrane anchor protein [Massilia cavernae]RJG08396.1 transmembrane anchor protein [Massilia cavernae]